MRPRQQRPVDERSLPLRVGLRYRAVEKIRLPLVRLPEPGHLREAFFDHVVVDALGKRVAASQFIDPASEM